MAQHVHPSHLCTGWIAMQVAPVLTSDSSIPHVNDCSFCSKCIVDGENHSTLWHGGLLASWATPLQAPRAPGQQVSHHACLRVHSMTNQTPRLHVAQG